MRFLRTFLAGLLLAGTLALTPNTSWARGGGGGGHFGGGGGHFAGAGHFSGGRHLGGFHNRGFGFAHHPYHRFYGFYGPFDYGFDDYAGPYYDDNDLSEVSPPNDQSTSLTISVQKELTQLGYYRGPIDGIAGSETAQAVRWFQSVNHLQVTGQIDSETIEAMRIG